MLATPLYTHEATLDFAARMARLLARRLRVPVFVGSSASFAAAGLGGSVEEEAEATQRCVEAVLAYVGRARESGADGTGPDHGQK